MEIQITKLDPAAILPTYAHGPSEDAGLDLYALDDVWVTNNIPYVKCPTGIAIAIPPSHHGHIRPRSGLAYKYGITCHQGTIDPGYRGEIIVLLQVPFGFLSHVVKKGERVAQLVIQLHDSIIWKEVNKLDDSNRGSGGFGSSGI